MPNFIDKIQKIYDKEIRECCDGKQKNLIDCLKENGNNEFVCSNEIMIFQKCITEYTNQFSNKYSKVANFRFYY